MAGVIKFVHVPMDKYYEFMRGYTSQKEDRIVKCETYLNMEESKIYFVEIPSSRGKRRDLNIYDDYIGDAILADSCKAINSMGLS